MRKHLTDPAVYMPTAIVLLTMTIWVMFNGLGPAWARWQHERTVQRLLVWTPEPWAITVDDFPAGTASDRAADERWLSTGMLGPVGVDPWRVAGLEHVLHALSFDAWWRVDNSYADGDGEGLWPLNGVRVGATDVFSFAMRPADTSIPVDHATQLLRHQAWLTHLGDDPDRRKKNVVGYELLGDALTEEEQARREAADAPFHPGEAGYYGNRVVVVDEETGERLEVVGVATVATDAFVAVGTVTPVGVEPEADAVELLELLAERVRNDRSDASSTLNDTLRQ